MGIYGSSTRIGDCKTPFLVTMAGHLKNFLQLPINQVGCKECEEQTTGCGSMCLSDKGAYGLWQSAGSIFWGSCGERRRNLFPPWVRTRAFGA